MNVINGFMKEGLISFVKRNLNILMLEGNRNGKVLAKKEILGKRHQLIIKRILLFRP